MKVGMISTWNIQCGISTYSAYLATELKKLGLDITILAERPITTEIKEIKTDVPYKYCWKRTEYYTELIEECKNYDIIHMQHQYGLFNNEKGFISLLKEITPKKILTLHDVVLPNDFMRNYFDATFAFSDKLIVHTATCRNVILRWDCPREKLVMIPHGTKLIDVPSKEESRKILSNLKLPKDAPIILSWGFIWESKGITQLIKIFREVLKTYPDAIFIHAGGLHPLLQNVSYLKSILTTAMQNGLTPSNFKITQWVPENLVPIFFGASDLIVLNYMRGSASASGAAHRVMAAHRPIVGTDDPCLEDIPKYTVMRFDDTGLYKGIIKVLGDKNLQKELVEQADKMALETSWGNVAKLHNKIYLEE